MKEKFFQIVVSGEVSAIGNFLSTNAEELNNNTATWIECFNTARDITTNKDILQALNEAQDKFNSY